MNRREALAALVSLPASATVTRAAVTPLDVIVIESDEILSSDQIERIEYATKQVWPDNKVVVLSRGMRLKIARQA